MRCTKDPAAHPASCIHVCWQGHTKATKFQWRWRSGRRGNRHSYHASPINRGAGEALLPPRTTLPSRLLASFRTKIHRRALAPATAAGVPLRRRREPEPRRRLCWGTGSPSSPTDSPVSSSPYRHGCAPWTLSCSHVGDRILQRFSPQMHVSHHPERFSCLGSQMRGAACRFRLWVLGVHPPR